MPMFYCALGDKYMILLEVVLMVMTRDIGSAVNRWVKAEFNDCHNALLIFLNSPNALKFLRTLNEIFLLLLEVQVF